MNYIDKERNIIKKLKETNYAMFDGNKDEALDFIGEQLNAFPNYANTVINQQILTPIIYAREEGENLRDKIQDLDNKRRLAHESAINSVNILNRLSKNLGLEPFADIDTTDRYIVADFVGQYVSQIYQSGQGKTLDDVTLQKRESYTKKSKERLAELDNKFGDITNSYYQKGENENNVSY